MTDTTRKIELESHLRWVPLEKMRVSPEGHGQRELARYRVAKLLADNFDPEVMGYPVVSERDGHFWIIDGQCRVEALKMWLGDWKGQSVQCRVFTGLDLSAEARLFRKLNAFTIVTSMQMYRNAVTEGLPEIVEIDRTVRTQGLLVSKDKADNTIGAVATLIRIYKRAGSTVLGRSLRIARDAYGKPGLEADVIDGLSLLCQRFNGELDEGVAITKLSNAYGGVNGLLGKAYKLRGLNHEGLNQCVAAAAVELINTGKGGKKLPSWWKTAA